MVIKYSRTTDRYTPLDVYSVPRIHDLFHKLAKLKVFTKMDLKSSYYQVAFQEEEKIFTSFEADGQLFHYTRILFGLCNAVSAFQRVMSSIIRGNTLSSAFVYTDDVIICSKDQEECDENLKSFKDIARNYSLSLKEEKCHDSLNEISYHDYTIAWFP